MFCENGKILIASCRRSYPLFKNVTVQQAVFVKSLDGCGKSGRKEGMPMSVNG